uniref:Uncharacterized protein LOC111117943 n=1 Tax=Crassostrea virginica TaxID=6565 RepID=A0A8B8CAV2_CRAVI|nr:uncharacterized protein LOC111117943 [Crassostrea virginica]
MNCYLLVLLFVLWETEARVCRTSYDCPQRARCCRNSHGDTLPLQEGKSRDILIGFDSPLQSSGRCSSRLARKNEQCDPNNCECEQGLDCYRPMSGICCPLYRCYNATWVKQQREFWEKCFRNPRCRLPM